MAFRANQQLREDIWDYRHQAAGKDHTIVRLAQPAKAPATSIQGSTALDLVQQAAEIFKAMEGQARAIEARAQSMCDSLAAKLRLAEQQRDTADRAHRAVVAETNGRLQEMAKALQQAHARITTMEDQAVAAEFRAQAVGAKLNKANQELAAVEEAIRKRLL